MSIDRYIHRLRPGMPGGPILFAFHGTGGDENQFFDFASRLMPQATVVSPRGDIIEGGAARFFKRKGEGVYDMDDLSARTAAMAAFVAAHVVEAQAGAVIGFGYSNGANILASTMFENGTLFDAAALMHPLISWTPRPTAALAGREVLLTAGRNDPICPSAQTERLITYLTDQGVALETVWHPGGHEICEAEIAALQRFTATFG